MGEYAAKYQSSPDHAQITRFLIHYNHAIDAGQFPPNMTGALDPPQEARVQRFLTLADPSGSAYRGLSGASVENLDITTTHEGEK